MIYIKILIIILSHSGNSNQCELIESTKTHNFSDECYADTFKISLTGSSILNSTATLEIISCSGDLLFEESFPSSNLIGYRADYADDDSIKVRIIKARVESFFDQGSFLIPAINEGDIFDSDYSQKDIWGDIKTTKSSVGFYYESGEGKQTKISFSKRLKKVVKYFVCC
jgi:hypothetical protein